ncbi:bifunctional DNA primase/polymerase [Rhizobium sp. P007]|uniref:bifunctional DNA primase/polymerase n=1 Tax=Rhizobium sp. P007 TaxID=285908 RepID=UPI0011577D5E|nr:bifunctional DNA primase/polymerase [Rhizobium sp. P007]CAD7057901.1 hypothetical protein RP007_05771 [Rhizobium sp. P007]
MTTPKDLALSYVYHGVPVFPCRAADEVTDHYDPETGEFTVLKSKTPLLSNGFKGARTNGSLVGRMWDSHPTAMVGIPTGEQLGAWVLDVDVHKDENGNIINGYETLARLEDLHGSLPDTAKAKTAGGGTHYYFKHVPSVRNRGGLGAGLDVRGSGGYVIAPGSRTADGREYTWIDYDGEGLPPLADAPEWLLKLVLPSVIHSAPSDYSYQPGSNDAYIDALIRAELEETAAVPMGAGRNNRLNKAAYALGTVVGAGALGESEARNLLQDVARGWGRDWTQCCNTIDNGLEAGKLNPRVIPERTSYRDDTPELPADQMVANKLRKDAERSSNFGATIHDDQPATPEEDEPPEYKLEAIADLESLTYPGGLVEDLIDWIVSSAEQPCRALAMAAVLPFVASLCGARYSTTSRDTRPNIYTVALADSGFGKEHARSQIKRLLMSDQGVFEKYSGPARIMSASALREVLEQNSSVNCMIDEFGGFVRDITDRKAGGHQRAISTDLRDYYSASSTFFEGAAYRGTPPKRIYNPILCVHGTSTPEQFWSALSSASAEDGLLPRLILFHIKGDKPQAVKPSKSVREVPYLLMERMAAVAGIDVAKKRSNLSKAGYVAETGGKEVKPYVIPWTPDAEGILRSVKETIEEKERAVAPEAQPFVRRIIENAIKLSIVVAVGRDPVAPIITEEVFEWAVTVAWTCAAAMLAEVGDRLADNQREANYKKIQGLIRNAGKKGLTEGRMLDRCKAIEAWQREDIIKDLIAGGSVVANKNEKSGPKTRRFLWVA